MGKVLPLKKLYKLHIRLDDVQPCIWRQILIDGRVTLPKFHSILQTVMGWQDMHLHEFFREGTRYGIPDEDFPNPNNAENYFRLDHLLRSPGDHLIYMYDFGNGWAHTITLEEVSTWNRHYVKPVCIDGQGACPPEDCGGPPGYAEIIEAINSPNNPELETKTAWISSNYKPEELDLNYINQDLKKAPRFSGQLVQM